MADFNRVLVGPSRDDLAAALEKGARRANLRCRGQTFRWPPDKVGRVFAEMDSRPQGHLRWPVPADEDPRPPASLLAVAWWTDHAGRKHYRVAGTRYRDASASLDAIFFSRQPGRELPLVYPDLVAERSGGDDGRSPVAVCPCGVAGPPESLGWMGGCCGPCHDRRQEGVVPAAEPFCQPTLRLPLEGPWSLSFSRDGRQLAGGGGCSFVVREVATGEEVFAFTQKPTPRSGLLSVAFSPAGDRLACASRDTQLLLWELPAYRKERLARGDPFGVAFSPDGSLLAVLSTSGIDLWDVSTRSLRARIPSGRSWSWIIRLAFSPDGRFLAATNNHHEAVLWEMPSGREYGRLAHRADRPGPLAFSPDGDRLAVGTHGVRDAGGADPPRVHLWDVGRREALASREVAYPPNAIGFTPDGSRLVFGGYDKVLHVWDATTFQPLTTFAWHTHPVAVLALSPDGRLLATGGADGVVHFWPTEMITGTKPDVPARE